MEEGLNKQRKKFIAALAAGAIALSASGCNTRGECKTIDEALSMGYTYSDLGVTKEMHDELKKIRGDIKKKIDVKVIAEKEIALGLNMLTGKVKYPYTGGKDGYQNITFEYGMKDARSKNEPYVDINGVAYFKGKNKGFHSCCDEVINCIDIIVDLQATEDYINGSIYDSNRDNKDLYEKYINAADTFEKIGANLLEFNENGDIVVKIISSEKTKEEPKTNSKDEER